jgi:poly-gamma-glutamate system protein
MTGPFRPRGGIWPVRLGALAIAAGAALALALVASAWPSPLIDRVPRDIADRARAAETTMVRAAQVIRQARHAEGVESEAAGRGATASFIGAELTPLTTTLGSLEAKHVATSPRWASALALRLHESGLRRGDVIAAGLSGSFPGLNVALAAACQSLGVKLVAVSSVTASSWGANQPGFTWPEIELRLVKAGVLRQATIAVTAGGAGDRARDLEPEGRAQAERIANTVSEAMRVPVLEPTNFEDAVALRMTAYARASGGRPIRLYANVGGTEASLGRSSSVLRLRNGFLPGVPFDLSRDRGVMARFAERGVRLLTLLNVRDLAVRWGIL